MSKFQSTPEPHSFEAESRSCDSAAGSEYSFLRQPLKVQVCEWFHRSEASFEMTTCIPHQCRFHRRGSELCGHDFERLTEWNSGERWHYDERLRRSEEAYLDYVAEEESTGNYAFIRDPRFEPARLERLQRELDELQLRAAEVPSSNFG